MNGVKKKINEAKVYESTDLMTPDLTQLTPLSTQLGKDLTQLTPLSTQLGKDLTQLTPLSTQLGKDLTQLTTQLG